MKKKEKKDQRTKTEKGTLYLKLFMTTFYLSAFTFGGGYVIIPLMKNKFVDDLHWIEENEMLDLTAIAQSSPGAVAVNAAILLGYQLAGISGSLVTIIGTILPPFLILSVVSVFYQAFQTNPVVNSVLKAMRPAVTAVIADVVFSMGSGIIRKKEWISILVMAASFAASVFFHINVMVIVLCCGGIGLMMTFLKKNAEKKGGVE